MGLLEPHQTFVRPPYLSLWEQEKENARRAVARFDLTAVAAA